MRLGMPALSRSAVAPTGHMSKSRNFPTRTRQTPTSRGTALDRTTIVAAAFSEHIVKCWRVTAHAHNGIRPAPARFLEGFSFRPATGGDWGRLGLIFFGFRDPP